MKRRNEALRSLESQTFDVCVIGGGATGAGCALDSQLRGLKAVLVDAGDFAGATSSKSTKIVHGGVRYLEEAVKELDPSEYHVVNRALHERVRMLKNGPYLARSMEFLVPCYHWREVAYYDVGLKLYDWIAGEASIFPSHFISREETLRRMPGLKSEKLVGSVAYADGQFDDARYNIALVKTFADAGGEALNYARVTAFERTEEGKLAAARIRDQLSQNSFVVRARAFVNATGPFADTIRELATPGIEPRMRPSKGIHVLLPLDVMPSGDALLIPKTEDGRVLFAVPWMGRLLVGTTEKEVSPDDELYITKDEVEYVLHHLNQYLAVPVKPEQVVSGLAGARPLVSEKGVRDTKKLSRDDELEVDPRSGLISIMGGKWTTYRAMAEDTMDSVQKYLGVPPVQSTTRDHPLVGSQGYTPEYWSTLAREHHISDRTAQHLAEKFGTDAPKVLALVAEDQTLADPILADLASLNAEVVYCARNEMAETIEDVLARRIGIETYGWRSSIHAAPIVAAILGKELGWSSQYSRAATFDYVNKINRFLQLAGLQPESFDESEIRQSKTEG